jgi:uncharacterized protein YjdB
LLSAPALEVAHGTTTTRVAAIGDDLDAHDTDPKPFTWTASAESITSRWNEDGRRSSKRRVNSKRLH